MNGLTWLQHSLAAFLGLAVCLCAQSAAANSKYMNNDIYEVVVQSDSPDQEQPGIYRINKKTGDSELILSGHLMGVNRANKGIRSFTSLGKNTANDALAVVDGKLTLLNYNTKSGNPKTYIQLGVEKSLPVVDILSGRSVRIPAIESNDDINILESQSYGYLESAPRGAQVYFVSVKAPSIMGSGLTFAFMVNGSDVNSSPSITHGKAFLISYDFLDHAQLTRLNPEGHEGVPLVHAPLLLESTVSQIQDLASETPIANRWKNHILNHMRFLSQGKAPFLSQGVSATFPGIPRFNLANGQAFHNTVAVEFIRAGRENRATVAAQFFDLFSRKFYLLDSSAAYMANSVDSSSENQLAFLNKSEAMSRIIMDGTIQKTKAGIPQIVGTSNVSTYPKFDVDESFDRNLLLVDENSEAKLVILSDDNKTRPFLFHLNRKILPDVKFSMIEKSFVLSETQKKYRVFFVNLVGKRGVKNGQIDVYIIEDFGSNFSLVGHKTIYHGPAMSTEEMSARIWQIEGGNDDILFDITTPVKGYAAYTKQAGAKADEAPVKRAKTVVYSRVLADSITGHPLDRITQRYVTPVFKRDLAAGLTYKYFDPTGARIKKSGFYLKKNSHDTAEEIFLMGRPLYSKKAKAQDKKAASNSPEEINHISDREEVYFPVFEGGNLMAGTVRLFPFSDQFKFEKGKELDVKSFAMGVSLTGVNLTGDMESVTLAQPYKSLLFTKIISGAKKHSDEVHILFGFRKDPSVSGSQDVLLVASAHIATDKAAGNILNAKLEIGAHQVLHRGPVNPADLATHLRVDSEGNYYWIADPSQAPDSARYSAKLLSSPESAVNSRRGGVGLLREPEDFKATQLGYGGKRFTGGGLWEILNEYAMKERINGASAVIETLQKQRKNKGVGKTRAAASEKEEKSEKSEKNEAKEAARTLNIDPSEKMIFESFDAHLNDLAQKTGPESNKIQVILVESEMKEKFRTRLITNLVGEKGGKFSLKNSRFHFYYADGTLDDVEVGQEFLSLQNTPKDESKMIFVEPEFLKTSDIKIKTQEDIQDEQEEVDFLWGAFGSRRKVNRDKDEPVFKFDEASAPANMAVILATGGGAKSLKGFEKVKKPNQHQKVPTVILATPEEWREIQSHNDAEADAGVFDEFEMNFEYLTSDWTMWPPNTEKVSEEIKEVAKAPYNPEEMKVFPSLERFINQAAHGELRGKQKILIVPPELLPIVNKLMLLRWSSNDFSASMPWSYGNRGMAFFKLNTKDLTQSGIQDNFQAIRGAGTTRNAVFYGDLETVMRIGRPTNPTGRNFTLRDPLKTNDSFILERDAERFLNKEADGEAPRRTVELDAESLQKIEDMKNLIHTLDLEIGEGQASLDQLEEADSEVTRERKEEERRLRKEIAEKESQRRDHLAEIAQIEQGPEFSGSDPNDRRHYPHMMWHVATEGQFVQPKKGKDWNLAEAAPRSAATILVGTEDQLAQIEMDLAFENKFFDLREHFEVEVLQAPDIQTKVNLVDQLFSRPEIAALGINFNLSGGESIRDAREQLIYQFVNRVDQLAYDQKVEKTTAFVRAFIALRQSLTEDLDLRRSRLIDENYIERLFTRVFPMPLNPKILPDQDPLNQISNLDQASRNFQKAGYEGPMDLKRRFFETILSQTRNTDTSRPIPNSQIIFGSTSTGKTFLLKTYFKMVGMTEYQPNKPSNENADYIIVQVGDLTADLKNEPSKMSVDAMIENILDLLSQPKGHRAYIVIDDFHKATSTEVRQKLFRFVMGIFEARNGMFPVRSKDGRRNREIPIQNLNIAMTLNPTSNEKMRREYVTPGAEYSPVELLKREVLAAMSDDKFKPEESELARWSDVINMDKFPRSAKVPELGRRVREYSRTNPSMMLVDPLVIDALVEKFAQANARELLAPAAAALTMVPHAARPSRVYTLTLRAPKPEYSDDPSYESGVHKGLEKSLSQVNLNELQTAVREITQVDPVLLSEPGSMVRFISFVFQNFRLQVFNAMSIEAHMSDVLRLDRPGMASVLKSNFLIATASHVLQHPAVPMNELEIRQDQLSYFNRSQQEEFYQNIRSSNSTSYFPEGFSTTKKDSGLDLDRFLEGGRGSVEEGRTRKDVIHEFVGRAQDILQKAAAIYLRLENADQLHSLSQWTEPQIREWFDNLKEQNPDAEFKAVMAELIGLFLDFGVEFNSADLQESQDGTPQLTIYDQVRFFDYILDKAMTGLPWGGMAKLAYDVVDLSSDFSLGARTSYKEYVGVHSVSPFAITTPEFMNEILEVGFDTGVKTEAGERRQRLQTLKSGFSSACELLLKGN